VLDRLAKETGIKCNAHSFRRGFATELGKAGGGGLDIMQLGRWSSVAMVQRYTRAYTFDDAATKYKPIVT
jgi:integrase